MPGPRHLDSTRSYRAGVAPRPDEVRFQVVVEETDLLVQARRNLASEVQKLVRSLRGQIRNHILLQPEFGTSLTPVPVPDSSPLVIKAMAEAASLAEVGPMAAVAGTIAQEVALALQEQSPDIIVENGGDVFLCSTRERVVGLLAIPGEGMSLGVAVEKDEFPVSFCSSSATIGHSLSMGGADLVVVRSRSGAVADAMATALANMLRGREDLEAVLRRARSMEGVEGVFAQMGGQVAAWGRMELVAL